MHSPFKTFWYIFALLKSTMIAGKVHEFSITGLLLHVGGERQNTILLTFHMLWNFLSDVSYLALPVNIHRSISNSSIQTSIPKSIRQLFYNQWCYFVSTGYNAFIMIVHLLSVVRYMLIFVY